MAGKPPVTLWNREKPMKELAIALILMVATTATVEAGTYEVLVVDIAPPGAGSKIAEFEKDARQFNDLHKRGYARAKPYFNLLHMANGQVYFVFGFRDEVQGIQRRNYPGTVQNLRSLRKDGDLKYPDMHWLPVEEIRKMLASP